MCSTSDCNSGLTLEQQKKLARYDKVITFDILARANLWANDIGQTY